MTITTAKGELEFWSEVRSPLASPKGKSRVGSIQPDYRLFYSGDYELHDKHLAAIEVKQYKRPAGGSFSDAINDYARGLPNGHIFLVNYGPMSKSLKLIDPERCSYMGQILPAGPETVRFVDLLRFILPKPDLSVPDLSNYMSKNDSLLLSSLPDIVYVDISASLNISTYKAFVSSLLTVLHRKGRLNKLYAVDTVIRGKWKSPGPEAIAEMASLSFSGNTGFTHLIPDTKVLTITDNDGLSDLLRWEIFGYAAVFNNDRAKLMQINEDIWNDLSNQALL